MRRAILKEYHNLVVEEAPLPSPKDGEILVEVYYTGICRTDRKCYLMGQRDLHLPRVLGHEISGKIAALGQGVTGYKVGDRVQVHPGIGCGKCPDCLDGNDHLCHHMKIMGFHLDGGFSEYCIVPAQGVNKGIIQKVPDNLPLSAAALCEPLACAVNMEQRIDFKDKKILIIGGGVLGLLMAKLAKVKGCKDVIVLEKDIEKVKIGKTMGIKCFPHTIDHQELLKIWPEGADAAIPCCPQNQGFTTALELLKKRGQLGFFSGLTGDEPMDNKTLNSLHYKELSLYGSYGCSLANAKESLRLLGENPQAFVLPGENIQLEDLEDILKNWEIENTIYRAVVLKEEEKND